MVTQALTDVLVATERVKDLRERMRAAGSHACAEKSRLSTLAWKESEGEVLDIRWARMLEKFLNERTIAIRDGELIVGAQTKYVVGASPELAINADLAQSLKEGVPFNMRGETEVAAITEEERRAILEDAEYWAGKSANCQINQRLQHVFGDSIREILKSRVFVPNSVAEPLLQASQDTQKVLTLGIRGVVAEAEAELERITFTNIDDLEKYNFLRATIIALNAVSRFAQRHAALARELAEKESDIARKRELEQIAKVCQRVPEYPASTFREAVQSYWFTYLCAYLECPSTPGRLDQILYPYYARDIENGSLTRNEAAELLGCLWIKFNELTKFQGQYSKEVTQGEQYQYVTVAGLTPDGKDATNELSFLLLEVARQIRLTRPSIALSYHHDISDELLLKAVETNRDIGGGIPAFLNGESCVSRLMGYGYSLEDARDIEFEGCVHPRGTADNGRSLTCNLNTQKIFELALHNGVDPRTGKQLGPATGDPTTFQSFEYLMDAFKAQFTYWVDWVCRTGNIVLLTKKAACRFPLHSALTKDCLSRGRDVLNGGVRYPQYEVIYNARGMQNIANSMIAIKRLVFEQKKISMAELLDSLRANFEGREELRQQLLAQPKWGNDDDDVDGLHARLWDWTGDVLKNSPLQPWVGKPIIVRRGGATFHYLAGKSCGAFPDGRKAGEPMADGNVSPAAGTDHKGPTAVINSASKLSASGSLSNLFNMKFPPYLLKSEENQRKLLALIKTYFARDGYHIQFNMIGREILLDAKAHPEKYRDLVVRVAGFSAYFVDLVPSVQDDIIARTEQPL